MLRSDGDFHRQFGQIFERSLLQAREYVAHPEKLRAEVSVEEKQRDLSCLQAPFPDPFALCSIGDLFGFLSV